MEARGERTGGVPYGFAVAEGKRLVPHPGEAAAVALASRLRRDGMSLREIGAALVEAGHAPRTGKRWHVAVIARVVAAS